MIPIITVICLVIAIAAGMLIWRYYDKHYVYTKERADLTEYFSLADENDIAVIEDDVQREGDVLLKDDRVYVSYDLVHELNDRFYLDRKEGLLIYCTDNSLVSFDINDTENKYFINHQPVETEYPILLNEGDEIFLELEFIDPWLMQDVMFYRDPGRLVIISTFEPEEVVHSLKNTAIRIKGGIKSPILKDVEEGDTLSLLEEGENWEKVSDNTGFVGYVEKGSLSEVTEEQIAAEKPEEIYTHLSLGAPVSMLWHQTTNTDENDEIGSLLNSVHGVNVMSPTWFYMNDNEGGLADLSSTSYIQTCHDRGLSVWPLVSNLENSEVDDNYVLSHTSLRRQLEENIIQKYTAVGADGINLDFEQIEPEYGEDYVQFVRELSLMCAENGLILSVDTYVPQSYSKYYNRDEQDNYADYVVIMGYDEHYVGSDEGSVASLPFVSNGVKDTIAEGVEPSRIVLGMPFYTRLWIETPKAEAGSDLEQASDDYVDYDLKSEAISMPTQNATVAAHNAVVTWIEELGQNFAVYIEDGITYKIWMEDLSSLEKKLGVVKDNAIAGCAFWKAKLEVPEVWDLIAEVVDSL